MVNGFLGTIQGVFCLSLINEMLLVMASKLNEVHPPLSLPTPSSPHQERVTCYTCVNVSDNLVCNQFAIDRPCPQGDEFCHTLHVMDSHGRSVLVNKKCADRKECTPDRVGCLSIDTQWVCVSCCDQMYCNVSAPSNHSTAIYDDSRTRSSSESNNNSSGNASGSGSHALRNPYNLTPMTGVLLLIAVIASCGC